ncbi:YncE family protein [Aeromicrobium sp.]|uniref:YncE family protein n=1 Tax=Aeromicrobium sp. TaxID=1871063 RepID=UPI003C41BCAE
MTSRAASRQMASVVVAAIVLLAACGGSVDAPTKKAAEPGRAPAVSTPPAGDVVDVGALPQGIVYDDRTATLAVAVREPFRLLLLDPDTLAVRKSVALPGKVRHLQLATPGGPVLVPTESANAIVEVALPAGTTRTTKVQRQPHDAAAAANGDLVVGNEFSGSISIVRNGMVLKTFDDLLQPGGVITSGSMAAIIDVKDYSLTTYDLDAMVRSGRVAAGQGPTHAVLVDDNRLAITDTRGDRVVMFSLDPLRKIGSIRLSGNPYGIAVDPSSQTVWVTLTTKNKLVGLDMSTNSPAIIATYPTVAQADTVAVAPGSRTLWVTGTRDGTIQRITR